MNLSAPSTEGPACVSRVLTLGSDLGLPSLCQHLQHFAFSQGDLRHFPQSKLVCFGILWRCFCTH
jgi:hypothetical protein